MTQIEGAGIECNPNAITRRSFLKVAATAALGAVGFGMTGCVGQNASPSSATAEAGRLRPLEATIWGSPQA